MMDKGENYNIVDLRVNNYVKYVESLFIKNLWESFFFFYERKEILNNDIVIVFN